jgi:hypothetical protein
MTRMTMNGNTHHVRLHRLGAAALAAALLAGCAGAGEGAVKGAAGGALAGAASGLVSVLVWGGDPGEHMARGATAGATVGAIGGAVEGSSRARAEKDRKAAQEQRDIDQIRREIGRDAFDGVVALAECRHEVALANAREATRSTNSNHALAGLWVQALTFADQRDAAALDTIESDIIRWDRGIDDGTQFRRELDAGYEDLVQIRREHSLPPGCG